MTRRNRAEEEGRVVRDWKDARHRATHICRTSTLGRRNGRCKGPEVGVCLEWSRHRDWYG